MPSEKQRRAAERRREQRRRRRRSEREARHRRFALLASIVGAVVVIAVVVVFVVATGNDDKKPNGAGNPPRCTWTSSGAPSRPVAPPPTRRPPTEGSVDIALQTSQGPMTFALDRSHAPCAVESFASLAEQHYFDGTSCHRLTSGSLSVLQCGDPTGTGRGGPGYTFADELSGSEKYTRGELAMANSGPNTNGSQFFIVYKDSSLQPNYTVFGRVTSGMKVVDAVAAKGSAPTGDGTPKLALKLNVVQQVN